MLAAEKGQALFKKRPNVGSYNIKFYRPKKNADYMSLQDPDDEIIKSGVNPDNIRKWKVQTIFWET